MMFLLVLGVPIRRGFLSHLVDTFKSKQIEGFVDDKLVRGDEIWPSLVGAIQGSSISLIIFSQDYASSRWCLEELVTILECRDKHGQIVIPVFYHVQPTDVRHQSGSYKSAFNEHERKYESNKVQLWKHALNKSANLSGLESSKFRDDDELLKEIVNCVLMRLDKNLFNSKGLVGIDKKIADVESLILEEPEDKCLIGIWGMGGIGKTTLVEEVFKKLRPEYQGSYFLANVRERSSKDGITSLKQEIFRELLGHDVKIDTPNSFPSDRIHLEKLLGTVDNFGSGSRIMITTRDVQVLNANNAREIYQLREFSSDKALELFKLNAFNPNDNQREYDELSEKMVNYAKGVPLVLKVLARLLRGKIKQVWESEIGKLEKMPLPEVYDVMKLSYDDLDSKERQLFLELACFFLRSYIKVEKGYLKSLLNDSESDNSVAVGLERLKDKGLITFSENGFVSMHDSLKEMACEIVRRESVKDPGSCSWLWDPNDIYEALTNNKGAGAIRSIVLHSPLLTVKKQELSHRIFSKMSKLRFLEIYVKDNYDFNPWLCKWQFWRAEQKVGIDDIPALKFLPSELRLLHWHNYPPKSLPENFSGKELVILKLQGNMKKLWDGVKNLVNLKELDLSFSDKLKKLPDLSKATNLEELHLEHPSIFSLTKLETLNFCHCYSLTTLSSDFHLSNLSYLYLDHCKNLRKFSLISDNMMVLSLKSTDIKALPSSFGLQSKLRSLYLSDCKKLQTLPEFPWSLKTLDFQGCGSLKTLPEFPLSLKTLDVSWCYSLQTLPGFPLSLKTLDVSRCDSLKTLPEFPLSLKTLDVSWCISLKTLPEIPLSLKTLKVFCCRSLQTLPELPLSLETLVVYCCNLLQTLRELPLSLETLVFGSCNLLQTLPELPLSLKTLEVKRCKSLKTLPKLPMSLEMLDACDCESLKTVLFPSTIVEQLKENRKRVLLWNCWNLDEQSLVAVGLNAQINVMKFANQHLSTPNQDHVEDYVDYDNKFYSYQAVYAYPGSSVPEWLEYKTRKNYVIIDLSSSPPSPLIGFIFCFVIDKSHYNRILKVVISVSEEAEGEKDSVIMYVDDIASRTYDKSYVCVVYDKRCSSFLRSRAKNQRKFKIEFIVSAELNGIGVSPVNTSTYNSFIQQMELRDSMSHVH